MRHTLLSTLFLISALNTYTLTTPTAAATATSGALKAQETNDFGPSDLAITIYNQPGCNSTSNAIPNSSIVYYPYYAKDYVITVGSHLLSLDLLPTEQLDLSLTGSAFTMTIDDVEGVFLRSADF